MRVCMIGDVVGAAGCDCLRRHLPELKKLYKIDFVIVNGENSAEGNGILPSSAEDIFTSGADVITTGNHVFRRREIYEYLEGQPFIIRPANYPEAPGHGYCVVDAGKYQIAVVNLMGTVYMDNLDNPFYTIDNLLQQITAPFIFVDFHAEATAEKKAMGYYLDGRVTALVGTHTHVQTADEEVLPQGSAYITDLGMTGPVHSVLGIKPAIAIEKIKSHLPQRFSNAGGICKLNGLLIDCDETSFQAASVQRIAITD